MGAASKLGTLLRRLRKEKNLTQLQLSEISGISRVQIAYLETGKRGKVDSNRIGWGTMAGLAKAFGLQAEELAKLAESEPTEDETGPRQLGRPTKLIVKPAKNEAEKPTKPATKKKGKGEK